MAENHKGRIVVVLKAKTGLARAFIAAVSIPVFLGWKPSEATADRLAEIAASLIRVKAVEARPSWRRMVIPFGSKGGWRRYIGGPRYLSLHLRPKG